eukprot:6177735-Pleurochrysis_carterae.AAC.1
MCAAARARPVSVVLTEAEPSPALVEQEGELLPYRRSVCRRRAILQSVCALQRPRSSHEGLSSQCKLQRQLVLLWIELRLSSAKR